MTPKEKADELILRHSLGISDIYLGNGNFWAKFCALITVNEIINEFTKYDYCGDNIEVILFWKEVKQEILNL